MTWFHFILWVTGGGGWCDLWEYVKDLEGVSMRFICIVCSMDQKVCFYGIHKGCEWHDFLILFQSLIPT